jgi:hypothetical protein
LSGRETAEEKHATKEHTHGASFVHQVAAWVVNTLGARLESPTLEMELKRRYH